MITRDQAIAAGDAWHVSFYHVTLRNRDGSALSCRVNGKCKIWKRLPKAFQLPVKYGFKECFYLTERNAHEWLTYDPTEETREKERIEKRKIEVRKKLNLADNVPDEILHDAMIDAGYDANIAKIVCSK